MSLGAYLCVVVLIKCWRNWWLTFWPCYIMCRSAEIAKMSEADANLFDWIFMKGKNEARKGNLLRYLGFICQSHYSWFLEKGQWPWSKKGNLLCYLGCQVSKNFRRCRNCVLVWCFDQFFLGLRHFLGPGLTCSPARSAEMPDAAKNMEKFVVVWSLMSEIPDTGNIQKCIVVWCPD